MSYIREELYHLTNTPDVIEASEYGSRGWHYTGENYIKATLSYEKGNDGLTTRPRGYYIGLNPVTYWKDKEFGHNMMSFKLTSNLPAKRILISTCNRKTKKNEAEAIAFYEEQIFGYLRDTYGYEVETEPERR